MKDVGPIVVKIAETVVHPEAMQRVLETLGVSPERIDSYLTTRGQDGQALVEFAGRICYQSYEPGLNPNVTRVREAPADYFANIIKSGDGSILEHGFCSFAILNASRVATHEIVRHRVGTAISQESLRYVRPKELKFWIPDELSQEQRQQLVKAVETVEATYRALENQIPWNELSMEKKKRLTSALRRILPQGMGTSLIWTANHRTLRWVIEMRTDPAAEVEIRKIFNQVAEICRRDYPYLYSDFEASDLPDGTKSWKPRLRSKV